MTVKSLWPETSTVVDSQGKRYICSSHPRQSADDVLKLAARFHGKEMMSVERREMAEEAIS